MPSGLSPPRNCSGAMKPVRLLVEISAHGFGHLAQTAPVLNALKQRLPGMELIFRTRLTATTLARRVQGRFDHIDQETDPSLVMNSAVHVDAEGSHARYRAFHQDWDRSLEREAEELLRLAPDLVLTNISYRGLAAAALAGIPCAAMSSIHWGEIYRHYCGSRPQAALIAEQIFQSYASAGAFLQLTPGMAMPGQPGLRRIGLVAAPGAGRSGWVRERLGVPQSRPLALLALGGISTVINTGAWPEVQDLAIISALEAPVGKSGYFSAAALDLGFADLLASCDAVVTKPGYGTFTEAACGGVRVLYTRRPDWPEAAALTGWLDDHARAAAIDWETLVSGKFLTPLRRLLVRSAVPPAAAVGIPEAADAIVEMLSAAAAS